MVKKFPPSKSISWWSLLLRFSSFFLPCWFISFRTLFSHPSRLDINSLISSSLSSHAFQPDYGVRVEIQEARKPEARPPLSKLSPSIGENRSRLAWSWSSSSSLRLLLFQPKCAKVCQSVGYETVRSVSSCSSPSYSILSSSASCVSAELRESCSLKVSVSIKRKAQHEANPILYFMKVDDYIRSHGWIRNGRSTGILNLYFSPGYCCTVQYACYLVLYCTVHKATVLVRTYSVRFSTTNQRHPCKWDRVANWLTITIQWIYSVQW